MQPTFFSSRILLPVHPWFVFASLLGALALNFLPTSAWPWMPDWVALVAVFWGIREPRYVGMGTGFLLGLIMDVADASVMGQHALAYVLASYGASALSRRILWFPIAEQALQILPLLLIVRAVQLGAGSMSGHEFPGLDYFLGPIVGAVLWWPLTFVLLLPQYQPVDRDDTRPI